MAEHSEDFVEVSGSHFVIEYSEPAVTGGGHRYQANGSLDAVCDSADYLVVKAVERYLDAMPPLPEADHSGSRGESDV